jgi:drug/metabolite transporter (DMT)-like permease
LRIFGERRFVVLAFSLLVLFWGSSFAVVKIGLDYSPPVLFAGLRQLDLDTPTLYSQRTYAVTSTGGSMSVDGARPESTR